MAHYQKNPLSVNPPAVSIEERPALNETVNVDTAVKTVEVPADMQTEALAVDEHTTTTKTADVSAETDSDEQARQKVTEILVEWKRMQETQILLYGQPDRRIFVTRRRPRFRLQAYMRMH
ncbi:hypothetical protein K438DRAFT_1765008 [Mycena galopus ATCC 62051]|nr:hypothetical protein K438DRAFT_1765008 [Mycena galopus ATCC 62051]